ncbi:MAG TPA: DUF3570 domain-containing protein [Burkholderiaceae bacterium]|nr:DUF3570 domain-containing protein [Burkholderiaceae bacterium]
MAASRSALLRRWQAAIGSLLALFGAGSARTATLPADRAEAMFHNYAGGGVTANGPALLVRKSLLDKVSLSGSLYVDAVSNASVDVVTTASKYKERRTEWGLGADYAVRDALLSLGLTTSKEPDYRADAFSVDVAQETLGGQTTLALGFTRAADKVGQAGVGFFDAATHWQYRLGVTQILSPKWIASANLEAIADSGYLGNPYRAARVFGAAVPERVPRTRSSRALNLRSIHDLGARDAVRGSYRHFWDNWGVKAHTVEGGYSRYVGESFLLDGYLRFYKQTQASFYSDNAQADTLYVTRNRQLGDYDGTTLGGKAAFTWKKVPGQYEVKANLALELLHYRYRNYTDLRTGSAYALNAGVVQLYVTANY